MTVAIPYILQPVNAVCCLLFVLIVILFKNIKKRNLGGIIKLICYKILI